MMDGVDFETTLKKIDKKFTEKMTNQDKQLAAKQFRLLYSCIYLLNVE
jgi:hypothetical protein